MAQSGVRSWPREVSDGTGDKPMPRNINEPTAAVIAGGMDEKEDGGCKELIYDMQSDTFDTSYWTIEDGTFEV